MVITRSHARFLSAILFFLLLQKPISAAKKSYVVYLGRHAHHTEDISLIDELVTESHRQIVGSILGSREKAQEAIFYSYTRYINGFSAILEEEEAIEISKRPDVVSVFPNRGHKLHTTRSWDFLGLESDGVIPDESIWKKARFGEDIIIANIDTGVWPESKSFNDEGMSPVPSRWKGTCQNGDDKDFHCNRKLIGARYYNRGYRAAGGLIRDSPNSPRDHDGHGTHTLSTAAGRFVPGVSYYGHANGTAKGGSPMARVAAYKVCWPPEFMIPYIGSCYDSDIIAAIDDAIHDGVDVISLSLGGSSSVPYFKHASSIGAFHAVMKGISFIASAGNGGESGTVTNVAPWVLTVAASSLDREFSNGLVLDNNEEFKGLSLSSVLPSGKLYPIIDSKEAGRSNVNETAAQGCYENSLDPKKVKGKIVVCPRWNAYLYDEGEVVRKAGGAGIVIVNQGSWDQLVVQTYSLPATQISYSDGLSLYSYLNSTKKPLGKILDLTKIGVKPAPVMADFSSQGPNTLNPEILKPDITAPGVMILAAFSEIPPVSNTPDDNRRPPYRMLSGTSMSCPHVSGIVGLLKNLHPDWSPSAIKSAIMTTARIQDNNHKPISNDTTSYVKAGPFNYGSGHIRPNRAMDPGLVYDLTIKDYTLFLCAVGYNSTQIRMTIGNSYKCPSERPKIENMNYPSITANVTGQITVKRTVKNVGHPGTYVVRVEEPEGISVSVKPRTLKFKKLNEEGKFEITLKKKEGVNVNSGDYKFGKLIWSDGKHYVRSPIVVGISS